MNINYLNLTKNIKICTCINTTHYDIESDFSQEVTLNTLILFIIQNFN